MTAKSELFKVVDLLEQMWVENQTLQIVLERSPHLDKEQEKALYEKEINSPANAALARQEFSHVRELIESSLTLKEVLEALQSILQKSRKYNRQQ